MIEIFSNEFIPILDSSIKREDYMLIDLSTTNPDLNEIDITNVNVCQSYIDTILIKNNATVAYGGYLEKRNLYYNNPNFSTMDKNCRNIHLGVDFWTKENTKVLVPLDGEVHSYKNNAVKGDYGPTIILKHNVKGQLLYSLYGHLSIESLHNIYVGKVFNKGSVLATLGTPKENIGYAPHLHFQLIKDVKEYSGDYPGVCAYRDLEYYANNCPNPEKLLHIKGL